MKGWLPERVETVLRALLESDAQLSPPVRKELLERAAGEAGGSAGVVPQALAAYADRIAHTAYKITDGELQQLGAAGHSEDEIFEATLVAAFGAGLRRLRKGLSLLRGGKP